MNILLILLQAAALAAEPAEAPQMTAPLTAVSASDLHDQFIEGTDDARKNKVLQELSRTPASGPRDVAALFDLFMRFPDTQVRDAALASLQLMTQSTPDLDVLLVHYLQQPEPEAQIFAIKGAVRLRDSKALPLIQKIADRKFSFKSANDAVMLTEKNEWWVQYEALAALAQWNGEEALPLLLKRSDQAPEVARILGRFLWKQSLPTLVKWAGSSSKSDQDRAHSGLTAPAPTADLRQTRAEMLAVLRDPNSPREARHQLAIKIGLCSTSEEAAELVKEQAAQKTDEDKLMFKTAVFATMDKVATPLLLQTAKGDLNPRNRAGALLELKDLLSTPELRALYQTVIKNDPDPENRDMAERELKLLPR